MATCKDCIHERVCLALIKSGLPYDDLLPAEAFCMTFKNKNDVVKVVRCKDCKNRAVWKQASVKWKGKHCAVPSFKEKQSLTIFAVMVS